MAEVLFGLLHGHPALVAIILFCATFILEDVATIVAGVFVAGSQTDPASALAALVLGTALGDLALYALGRWGGSTRLGQRLLARSDVRRAERWIAGRALRLTFAARFVPGLRMPVFTASGLVRAPAWPFAAIVLLTTPIWTLTLFTIARSAGEVGAQRFLSDALPLGLLLGIIMVACWRVRPQLTA
jgi:membrane protein DedA with SNARE-associated domain